VLQPLTVVLLVASGVLALLAAHHLLRGRLVDDPLILVGAAIEVALVVQLVVGLTKASAIDDGAGRATFIAYLFTVLVVIPATIVIAVKEKTQWAMAVVLGGAFVVAILVARLQQVWTLHA
jgi:flavin reductase (DIM6/NTAB) family NADH-FMN oxidoreductase RutF